MESDEARMEFDVEARDLSFGFGSSASRFRFQPRGAGYLTVAAVF